MKSNFQLFPTVQVGVVNLHQRISESGLVFVSLLERLCRFTVSRSFLQPFQVLYTSLINQITMADTKVYRASTTAPVNIAVVK